jgi:hypothetical protein
VAEDLHIGHRGVSIKPLDIISGRYQRSVMPNEDLQNRIMELLQNALEPIASQLADAIRTEALAEAKRELLSRLDVTPVQSPQISLPPATTSSKPRRNGAASQRKLPAHCVYPDCNNPHKGPRFSFMCEQHMGVGKRDKGKYLLEWKQKHSA